MNKLALGLMAVFWLLAGCSSGTAPVAEEAATTVPPSQPAPTFVLTSAAFADGGTVPQTHVCSRYGGDDRSPPLAWSGEPEGTVAYALIVDDPDAPRAEPFVHWVLYDLPAGTTALLEAVPAGENGPDGSRQGRGDFGRTAYGGPCPPAGPPHRYIFKLYALSQRTGLPAGATKAELLAAMEGLILAQTSLTGTFGP